MQKSKINSNVLVLTSSFPKFKWDSVGNFVYELAKKLKEKGVRVTVLCPHHPYTKLKQNMSGLNVYRFPYFYPFSNQKLCREGGMIYNWKNSYIAKIQVPFFFFSELFFAAKLIREKKINVINSHWLIPQGLVGAICHKIFGTRHIATIHSSEITFAKKVPGGRKIMEFIVNNSDTIVSVSSHRANELLSFVSSDISKNLKNMLQIIQMGVELIEFRKDKNELLEKNDINSKFIVLFIGRLVDVKGCEYLIKGFKSVIDNFSDVQLIIVGPGPLESDLKKLVKQLNISEHVRFEGFVEHGKISDYYSLSDIVVFPSIVDSVGYKEGMPIALLEAFAAGKPIVATRTGGFIEAIEDGWTGFLVEPKNEEQIAEKILDLLNNAQLRDKFSEKALESSKKYDWNIIVNKYLEIFRTFKFPLNKCVESS